MKTLAKKLFNTCAPLIVVLAMGCAQTIDLFEEEEVIIETKVVYAGNANSDVVPFSWESCNWTIQFRDIDFTFTIDKNVIKNVTLTNDADEKSTNCGTAPFQRQQYLFELYDLTGNNIFIKFSPGTENIPKCDAFFTGVRKTDRIEGILIWRRVDQVGTLAYEIVVPIVLMAD